MQTELPILAPEPAPRVRARRPTKPRQLGPWACRGFGHQNADASPNRPFAANLPRPARLGSAWGRPSWGPTCAARAALVLVDHRVRGLPTGRDDIRSSAEPRGSQGAVPHELAEVPRRLRRVKPQKGSLAGTSEVGGELARHKPRQISEAGRTTGPGPQLRGYGRSSTISLGNGHVAAGNCRAGAASSRCACKGISLDEACW